MSDVRRRRWRRTVASYAVAYLLASAAATAVTDQVEWSGFAELTASLVIVVGGGTSLVLVLAAWGNRQLVRREAIRPTEPGAR